VAACASYRLRPLSTARIGTAPTLHKPSAGVRAEWGDDAEQLHRAAGCVEVAAFSGTRAASQFAFGPRGSTVSGRQRRRVCDVAVSFPSLVDTTLEMTLPLLLISCVTAGLSVR
jgi:hypothetical protein